MDAALTADNAAVMEPLTGAPATDDAPEGPSPRVGDKRERPLKDENCAFCHEGEDSDDPDEDPLVPVVTGKSTQQYAHDQCLWWCPDLVQVAR
jgi:hypothetical protein